MNIELLKSGVIVMIIGMLVVFFFLVIMIYSMEITSKIVAKFDEIFPPEVKEEKKPTKTQDEETIAVAVAVAVSVS